MQRRLIDLNIHHLRNIESAKLQLHSQTNFFCGANGSGKTSLLEAIYMLSCGHSFRTRETPPLIQNDKSCLTIFGRTTSDESISIQKSVSGPTLVKLNQQSCFTSSDLARFLPCQVIYQDIFLILDAGPAVRRSLIDWGLFHVEPSYHYLWKSYRNVLKQRNALLRQKASPSAFVPWDHQLVELSCQLDVLREPYFTAWSTQFETYLERLTDVPCRINYFKGWDKKGTGRDFHSILRDQFSTDMQRQYTSVGAHQADIIFEASNKSAKHLFSRGQQKIILIALKLAQANLVPNSCIYLFDDIAAELDSEHLSRLAICLKSLPGQKFITATDTNLLNALLHDEDIKPFEVSQGHVVPSTLSQSADA